MVGRLAKGELCVIPQQLVSYQFHSFMQLQHDLTVDGCWHVQFSVLMCKV
jgi:hypothetical protein